MFYFYIFRCNDGTLYVGNTNYPPQREDRHNTGRGARFTKTHGGGEIVYIETYQTRAEAMHRETQVKKWSRIKKEHLIKGVKP